MPQLYPGRRYTRDRAPLQILRGYYPTEPGHLSVTATPKIGEGIKEGMAITLDSNKEWIKAVTAGNLTVLSKSVFVARQDQDNPAVQASGKLVGLDCSGQFEFQTGYVVPDTFTLDMEITIAAGGLFAKALTGNKVVGKVSALGAGAGGLIAYAGLMAPTAAVADSATLQFKTVAHYIKAV